MTYEHAHLMDQDWHDSGRLLMMLQDEGFFVRLKGTNIYVSGPKSKFTKAIKDEIKRLRVAIICRLSISKIMDKRKP